jgi:hypothetical protein
MTNEDSTAVAHAFAKTIAKIAEFANDLAESIHKDLGIEYTAPALLNKKKRKVTSTVDPNAPKKPKTAYLLFCDDKREEAKREGKPVLSMKELGEIWAALKEEDKETYTEAYDAAKVTWKEEMEEYKNVQGDGERSRGCSVDEDDDVLPPKKASE